MARKYHYFELNKNDTHTKKEEDIISLQLIVIDYDILLWHFMK